ncbi:hypothetical protein [Paraburkholderia graminis]|uniref:hypothetical protein n=1 Tax=Paraburkholderia graminis TaxID=60548 RepID=UPI00278EC35A|nr:hypothetical protein [Paraburkholderia graminis]MDQ0627153.1 hypothetical protein [Paraburkholderia graminis]
MSGDPNADRHDRPIRTDVAVFLGDCTENSFRLVCEGSSMLRGASGWQRALDALTAPSPRGPYPVANRFTIFLYELLLTDEIDGRVIATVRIDVVCKGEFIYASVTSEKSHRHIDPIVFSIGDDVVTVTRAILAAVP